MVEPKSDQWTVAERTPVIELVPDPQIAPYLRPERKVRFSLVCPEGHPLPCTVSVQRELFGMGEIGWGCGPCGRNYQIPLGEWPRTFPPLHLAEMDK